MISRLVMALLSGLARNAGLRRNANLMAALCWRSFFRYSEVPDPRAVAVGGSATGNIATSGDVDWFAVALTAGVTYLFDLQGNAAGRGTLQHRLLQLLNSSGHVLLSDSTSGGFGSEPIGTRS